MKGEYIIRNGDELITYNNYNDIPLEFDNLISFKPEYPDGPHSDEDHEFLETFVPKLNELMKRERK